MKKIILIAVGALIIFGCQVGPKFKSPEIATPNSYIYDSLDYTQNSLDTIALDWWKIFGDTTLDTLIKRAIRGNKDFLVTLSNIEIAKKKVKIARAELLPSFSLQAGAYENFVYSTKLEQEYSVKGVVSWEIDLFGKYKSLTKAAKNDYVASQYGAAYVLLSLCSEVATTYFTLVGYKQNLEVANETYLSRKNSFAIIDSMYRFGAVSLVDLEMARSSLESARVQSLQYRRAVVTTTLALNLLMGENPTPPIECAKFGDVLELEIPIGIPSSLLERRPDVKEKYYQLKFQNEMVRSAVAARLPTISLSGSGGLLDIIERESSSGKPLAWSGSATLLQPIFAFGKNKRAVEVAKEQYNQALLEYENSMINAISDVEKALIEIYTYKKQLEALKIEVEAAKSSHFLNQQLYNAGLNSYLDLLTADRTLFAAEQQYINGFSNLYESYIALYKALGGGFSFARIG